MILVETGVTKEGMSQVEIKNIESLYCLYLTTRTPELCRY